MRDRDLKYYSENIIAEYIELYTLIFYKQLRSGLSPESCLHFQGFRSSKLHNGCLAV